MRRFESQQLFLRYGGAYKWIDTNDDPQASRRYKKTTEGKIVLNGISSPLFYYDNVLRPSPPFLKALMVI